MSDKIVQISDLHITAATARRVLAAIRCIKNAISPHTPVIIAGDVFNNKVRVTAQEINTLHEMLRLLAPNPVHIIPGNHDFSYGDTDNLVTTVLQGASYPHVEVYATHTQTTVGNSTVLFVVPNDYTDPMPDIRTLADVAGPRYLVVHEPILGCKYYSSTENPRIKLQGLAVTGVMAGDIHKYGRHIIHNNVVVFSGSLVQKNADEYQDHGYVTWQDGDSVFTPIEDPHKPLRYVHIGDKFQAELSNKFSDIKATAQEHGKAAPITLVMKNCTREYLNQTVTEMCADYKIEPDGIATVIRGTLTDSSPAVPVTNSVDDLTTHTKLLGEYMSRNKNRDHIAAVQQLHSQYYASIYVPGLAKKNRTINWHMRYLSWENLYSYGPGNMVDFTTLTGLTSIVGRNGIGKSNLLRVLKFALFGTVEGTLCNVRAANWGVHAVFVCNGETYMIKRTGREKDKTAAATHLNFYAVNSATGTCKNITATTQALTQKAINDKLGSEEQFVTTHIIEPIKTSICDEKPADITAMLTQGTHFNLFRDIRETVDEQIRAQKKQVTLLTDRISKARANLSDNSANLEDLQLEKAKLERELATVEATIASLPGIPQDINLASYKLPPISQEQRDDLVVQLEAMSAMGDSTNMPKLDEGLLRLTNSSVTQEILSTYCSLYADGMESLIRTCAANDIPLAEINNLINIGAKYTTDQLLALQSEASAHATRLGSIVAQLQSEGYMWDAAANPIPAWQTVADGLVREIITNQSSLQDVVAQLIALSASVQRDKALPSAYLQTAAPTPPVGLATSSAIQQEYTASGGARMRDSMRWQPGCECCDHNQSLLKSANDNADCGGAARCLLYHMLCAAREMHVAKTARYNKVTNVLKVINLRADPKAMQCLLQLAGSPVTAAYKYRDLLDRRQAIKRTLNDERVALQSYRYLPGPLAKMVRELGLANTCAQITNAKNQRQTLVAKLHQISGVIGSADALQKLKTGLQADERTLRDASTRLEQLQLYSGALDPEGGIISELMQAYITELNTSVNLLLNTVSNFQLQFNLKKRNIDITFQHNSRPIACASGAQRFIIDVAIRIALIRNSRIACNLLIIDEGFGSLDQAHIEQLTAFLQRLGEEYRALNKCCLFISHIDELNDISKNRLSVSLKKNSTVSNVSEDTYAEISAKLLAYSGEKAQNESSFEADIINTNGVLTCKYCDKVQKSVALAKRHIQSATHLKAREAKLSESPN